MLCAGLASHGWAAAEVTLRDDRGRGHTFAAPPQRIVSLLPSLTESLCALGGCERLVGIDRESNWPARVNALPRIGGLEDAQIERIVALRPDVVLAASSSRVNDRLESLGVRVLVIEPRTHAEAERCLHSLAALLGTPEAAPPLWAAIERELALAAERVPAQLRGQRVYFEVDSAPYAAGETSFIGQTLARLSLGNVVPASLGAFPKLNPEFVVGAQPDIVMAAERALSAMGQRPGWAALRALQRGKRCGFTPAQYDLLVRPGPRLGEAARVLSDCLARLGRQP